MDAGEIKQSARTTIFHQLLTPNVNEGDVTPTVDDLKYEAYNMVAAASETVGGALETATYRVVPNQNIYKQLTAELKTAFPDPSIKLDFLTLEKLPYLVSVNPLGMNLMFV